MLCKVNIRHSSLWIARHQTLLLAYSPIIVYIAQHRTLITTRAFILFYVKCFLVPLRSFWSSGKWALAEERCRLSHFQFRTIHTCEWFVNKCFHVRWLVYFYYVRLSYIHVVTVSLHGITCCRRSSVPTSVHTFCCSVFAQVFVHWLAWSLLELGSVCC